MPLRRPARGLFPSRSPLGSFALGGLVGAAGAVATAAAPAAHAAGQAAGLAAFEDAPCFLELAQPASADEARGAADELEPRGRLAADAARLPRRYALAAMPIYEYRCPNGHLLEVFHGMNDPSPTSCEVCGASPLERVLHPVAVHYKGSGFYSTDYGRGGRKGGKDGRLDRVAARARRVGLGGGRLRGARQRAASGSSGGGSSGGDVLERLPPGHPSGRRRRAATRA